MANVSPTITWDWCSITVNTYGNCRPKALYVPSARENELLCGLGKIVHCLPVFAGGHPCDAVSCRLPQDGDKQIPKAAAVGINECGIAYTPAVSLPGMLPKT